MRNDIFTATYSPGSVPPRATESSLFRLCVNASMPRLVRTDEPEGCTARRDSSDRDAPRGRRSRRFSKASKLAAYGGFSPIVDSSGDEEEGAKRNGGLHKPLDGEGRQDVKFFFTEAGQSVLTSCGSSKLGTRNQFADAQAKLIYGNLPESEKTNEDTAVC